MKDYQAFLILYFLFSLVIPAIRLALSSVIYSEITLYFALNHVCSKWRYLCSKPRRTFLLYIASFLFRIQNEM